MAEVHRYIRISEITLNIVCCGTGSSSLTMNTMATSCRWLRGFEHTSLKSWEVFWTGRKRDPAERFNVWMQWSDKDAHVSCLLPSDASQRFRPRPRPVRQKNVMMMKVRFLFVFACCGDSVVFSLNVLTTTFLSFFRISSVFYVSARTDSWWSSSSCEAAACSQLKVLLLLFKLKQLGSFVHSLI